MNPAWGAPCSQPIVTARWTQPRGTPIAIPVCRTIAPLVVALVNRLGNSRGRDISQYGTWGYACRYISGTQIWSNHSGGLAVDLEAPSNGQGRLDYGSMPRDAGAIARSLGFGWGGWTGVGGTYGSNYTDPMHFEFLGTPTQAAYLIANLPEVHVALTAAEKDELSDMTAYKVTHYLIRLAVGNDKPLFELIRDTYRSATDATDLTDADVVRIARGFWERYEVDSDLDPATPNVNLAQAIKDIAIKVEKITQHLGI